MLPPDFENALAHLPQATLRVGPDLKVQWLEAQFAQKVGVAPTLGRGLLEVFEFGRSRDALERAIREGREHEGHVITTAMRQVRVQVRVAQEGEPAGAWLFFEPSGLDDEGAFSQVVQEVARAVGETLEVDNVCAAAVTALVRCARVRRAEVFLCEEDDQGGLRRAAVSDLAGCESPEDTFDPSADPFLQALGTRRAQIGIQRGYGDSMGSIFAAVPLCAPRRTVGLLLLYKEQGASFSVRELDLWTAAAGQLAVAVENARLLARGAGGAAGARGVHVHRLARAEDAAHAAQAQPLHHGAAHHHGTAGGALQRAQVQAAGGSAGRAGG